ncbi:hypothetical protein SS50377_26588 [Spironucleus salmonicida]|uniref:Uncharacterized protein n=1 Tax=Spironucleus salmonicida TaxID=348837 RepID=V6LCN8_9EUKA|nr:hypothetical protein SS50377_26588 [Spironucleus salmonicida]|eukprot:EST41441.1 hypothetical protein SS50377_19158 [Spironucleus salmonicida]
MTEQRKLAVPIDQKLRDKVLKSLQKAGDLSTVSIAHDEFKTMINNLETPSQFKTFISYITQTTSLQPILMRKSTFLVLDDLIKAHLHQIAPFFINILNFLIKRMQDPEITLITYQQQIAKSFEQLTILSNSSEKHQLKLFEELSFAAQKQSFLTKTIAFDAFSYQIQFSTPFLKVSELGNLAVQTAKNYHDKLRNRLQYNSLYVINLLLDINFFHSQLAEIAIKSLHLTFHKTREQAFLILEKLVLAGFFEENLTAAKQIFLKIQTLKYDQVSDVRVAGFRCSNLFKEFLSTKMSQFIDDFDAKNEPKKCSFREFRDRISCVDRNAKRNGLNKFNEVEERRKQEDGVDDFGQWKAEINKIKQVQMEQKVEKVEKSQDQLESFSYKEQQEETYENIEESGDVETEGIVSKTISDVEEETIQEQEDEHGSSSGLSEDSAKIISYKADNNDFVEAFTPEQEILSVLRGSSQNTEYYGDLPIEGEVNSILSSVKSNKTGPPSSILSPSNPSKIMFDSSSNQKSQQEVTLQSSIQHYPEQKNLQNFSSIQPVDSMFQSVQHSINQSDLNEQLKNQIMDSQKEFLNKQQLLAPIPKTKIEKQLQKYQNTSTQNLKLTASQKIKVSRSFVPQVQTTFGVVALQLIEKGRILEAYQIILSTEALSNKNYQKELLQVMNRTGPCLQMLDEELSIQLIEEIIKLLKDGFVDQMLEWIRQVLIKRYLLKFEQGSQILASLMKIWAGHPRWSEIEQLKQEVYLYFPQLSDY